MFACTFLSRDHVHRDPGHATSTFSQALYVQEHSVSLQQHSVSPQPAAPLWVFQTAIPMPPAQYVSGHPAAAEDIPEVTCGVAVGSC